MRAPKAPTIVLPPSSVADPNAPLEPTDEEIAKKLAEEAARQGRGSFLVNSTPTVNTGLNIPTPTY